MNIIIMRFEVLTTVYMKIKVIWDMTLCSLVKWVPILEEHAVSSALKVKTFSTEKWVRVNQTTRHCITRTVLLI
jgi:hypothetical protein